MALSIFQIAGILLLASHIVITIKAFQDEVFQGVMCLIVPFYIVYYGLRRLNLPGRGLFVLIYVVALGVYVWGTVRPIGPDACTLLTSADAEEFLGGSVGDPTRRALASRRKTASACIYATTTAPERKLSLVYGNCTDLSDVVTTRRLRPSIGLRELADEAYVEPGVVHARKGSVCIGVMSVGLPEGIEQTVAREQLAKKMIARLPQ